MSVKRRAARMRPSRADILLVPRTGTYIRSVLWLVPARETITTRVAAEHTPDADRITTLKDAHERRRQLAMGQATRAGPLRRRRATVIAASMANSPASPADPFAPAARQPHPPSSPLAPEPPPP
jgi:hypothetical protein